MMTPEIAAMFDDVAHLTRQQDRLYSLFEMLSHVPPARRPITSIGTRPRVARGTAGYLADHREHRRRYVDALDSARFELVDATHVLQAEQPEVVAARMRELLPV